MKFVVDIPNKQVKCHKENAHKFPSRYGPIEPCSVCGMSFDMYRVLDEILEQQK